MVLFSAQGNKIWVLWGPEPLLDATKSSATFIRYPAQGPTVGRFNKETSLSQAAWAPTFLSRFLSCCLPPWLLCRTKPTHHALTTSTSVLTLVPYLLLRLPHSFHTTQISTFAPGGLFLSSYKFLGPYLIQPNTRIPSANQSTGCCFL